MSNLKVDKFFYDVFHVLPDPRTKDLFSISNYGLSLWTVAVYLLICLAVGPMLMKNREPFKLKKIIAIYNFAMVLISSYVAYGTFMGGWGTKYKLFCEPIGDADDKSTLMYINAHYVYHLSKFIELFDTVFIVLRKKNSQITFLHVYHHAIVVLITYGGMRYVPDGHGSLGVLLNSIVHVVMYSYYFLSALGPKVQKYLWWKRYITTIQVAQFIVMLAHLMVIYHPSCSYPRVLPIVLIVNAAIFLILFINFYKKNYTKMHLKTKNTE